MNLDGHFAGIISIDPIVRMILPHMLEILGCDKYIFYPTLLESFYDSAHKKNKFMLFVDNHYDTKELEFFHDKLKNVTVFLLEEINKKNHCFSVNDCLKSFEEFKEQSCNSDKGEAINHLPGDIESKGSDSSTSSRFSSLLSEKKKKDHSFFTIEYVSMKKPLTMSGLLHAIKLSKDEEIAKEVTMDKTPFFFNKSTMDILYKHH